MWTKIWKSIWERIWRPIWTGNKEGGFVLIIILFSMSILMLLGSSLLNYTQQEVNIAYNLEENVRALYAAEAGIELALATIYEDYTYKSQGTVIEEDIGQGHFRVSLGRLQGDKRLVTSRGQAGRASHRITVEVEIEVEEIEVEIEEEGGKGPSSTDDNSGPVLLENPESPEAAEEDEGEELLEPPPEPELIIEITVTWLESEG